MKHAIFSLARFKDKDLFKIYLDVSREMLVPNLRNQTEKNFEWVIMVLQEDVSFVKDYLNMKFTPVFNKPDFIDYMQKQKFDIQTRHDIDDWMSPKYVEAIQRIYRENIDKYDKFLIQSQPRKLDYHTGRETPMGRYHHMKTSMFLSLCQREPKHNIIEKNHGQMWQITNNIFNVPDGMTKWVIHGNNKSCGKSSGK